MADDHPNLIALELTRSLAANGWRPVGSVSGPTPSALARTIESLARSEHIGEHGIDWEPGRWIVGIRQHRDRLKDSQFLIPHIERVANHSLGDNGSETVNGDLVVVRRRHLFELADADAVDFYVGVMAWGFGSTGYGWWRTAATAHTAGAARLRSAVTELRSAARKSADWAFRAWSRRGIGKLPGVGTAFASKLAYFAAFERLPQAPLIADANTAWAVWALSGIWDSRNDRQKYLSYLDVAYRWADESEARADEVERAFFALGPAVRKAWRQARGQ
jgi:hypothetical protein